MKSSNFALAALTLLLGACSGPTPIQGNGWREVGSLDDGTIPFVEVQANKLKDGSVYQDAIRRLCQNGGCVEVGFFAPGNALPPSGRRSSFFQSGGWGNYQPLAVYMGGEFTKWDCQRAGEDAAPLSALCGEGAKEQYDAVLDLATRDGWVRGCGLPPYGGRQLVEQFAEKLPEIRRRQIMSSYDEMLDESSSGPDDPLDCEALRSNIERKAERARTTLRATIKKRTNGKA
jgi:hypothetical protein